LLNLKSIGKKKVFWKEIFFREIFSLEKEKGNQKKRRMRELRLGVASEYVKRLTFSLVFGL